MPEFLCHFWVLAFTHIIASPIVLGTAYALRGFASWVVGSFRLEGRPIRGRWKTDFQKAEGHHKELAEVRQLHHWIWGTIDYHEMNRRYRFRGSQRENVIVAMYETEGPQTLDRGSFTLRLNDDGDKMEGCYSWTDAASKGVLSNVYQWTKIK